MGTSIKAAVTIGGLLYMLGDELKIRYGNGTQTVRIREITRTGRVKVDRYNAGRACWQSSNTAIAADDPRWLPDTV
jgi:hypothetical protein